MFFGHAHCERTRPKQEQRQQQQQQAEEGEAPLQEVDTSSSDDALHDEMDVNPFDNTQNGLTPSEALKTTSMRTLGRCQHGHGEKRLILHASVSRFVLYLCVLIGYLLICHHIGHNIVLFARFVRTANIARWGTK